MRDHHQWGCFWLNFQADYSCPAKNFTGVGLVTCVKLLAPGTAVGPGRVGGPGNGVPGPPTLLGAFSRDRRGSRDRWAPGGIFPGPLGSRERAEISLSATVMITGICIIYPSPDIELENKTGRPTRVVLSFEGIQVYEMCFEMRQYPYLRTR
jgi:hypothetical protein